MVGWWEALHAKGAIWSQSSGVCLVRPGIYTTTLLPGGRQRESDVQADLSPKAL